MLHELAFFILEYLESLLEAVVLESLRKDRTHKELFDDGGCLPEKLGLVRLK